MSDQMKFEIEITAIKDGKMEDGDSFCYKGDTYYASILDGDDDDGDFYYVRDELYNDFDNEPHGMDIDFFNEHFKIKG